MKKLLKLLFLFGLQLIVNSYIFAQIDTKEEENVLEKLSENQESNADVNEWSEQLQFFSQNKLNINTCTREQLEILGLLKDYQIVNLLEHRKKYGNFISILELQVVEGFDPITIKSLLPFIQIENSWVPTKGSFKDFITQGKNQINWLNQIQPEQNEGQRRRQENDTANKSYYAGNQLRSVIRYRYSFKNNISFSYVGEKDAGETFGRGINKKGFDYNSAHLMIGGFKHLQKLIVGDYNITFGQGLTVGSGLAFGKSAMVLNLKRNYNGIRPYRSVNENEFLRGVAATLNYNKFWITVFGAHQKLDGSSVNDTFSNDFGNISGLVSTGFHRTASEQLSKDKIQRTSLGANVSYKTNRLQLGWNIGYLYYNPSFGSHTQLYNLYKFSGSSNIKTGLDYRYTKRNYSIFGEVSMNQNYGFANYHVLLISLSTKLDAALMLRHYAKNFEPLLSNAIGENTENVNEQGFYTGLVYRLGRGFTYNGYFDFYRYPWITYKADIPGSYGVDHLSELDYIVSKKISLYVRYKYKMGQSNISNQVVLSEIENQAKHNFRFHMSMTLANQIELKSRVEASTYTRNGNTTETGVIAYQDIEKKWKKWSVNIRVAYFNTTGYNSRIYVYETELPFTYSVLGYYGNGSRYYMMMRYKINRHFEMFVRVSQTRYQNVQTIGSSLDMIRTNHKTDCKFMLVWKK